jgi:hypothetical protein
MEVSEGGPTATVAVPVTMVVPVTVADTDVLP